MGSHVSMHHESGSVDENSKHSFDHNPPSWPFPYVMSLAFIQEVHFIQVHSQRICGSQIHPYPYSTTQDDPKVGVVVGRKRKVFLSSKQRRYVFDGLCKRTRLSQLKNPDILKTLRHQIPIVLPSSDSDLRPLVTRFHLDQYYMSDFFPTEEFIPDSILEIVCQFAKLPKFELAHASKLLLRNLSISRPFCIYLLSREFELVLPIGLIVTSFDQLPQEDSILHRGLTSLIGLTIDARDSESDNEKRSEFAKSAFLDAIQSWGMFHVLSIEF